MELEIHASEMDASLIGEEKRIEIGVAVAISVITSSNYEW